MQDRPPADELDLYQSLPLVFARTLSALLVEPEGVLAQLFVPSERVLQERIPARALVVTARGVFVLEEGEEEILDQRWGVKARFYPFHGIAGLEMGRALLRGRLTIYGEGSAGTSEIRLHWYDLNNFRAAVRLIRQRMSERSECRDDKQP
jgi:hypothetical protein